MKMAVAVMDRTDRRAMPQMPWPEVQPPASRVPNPTNTPAAITTPQLAGICGDGIAYPTAAATSGARMTPATKAARQPLSLVPSPRRPAKMPLMPAIRPVSSIISREDRPISTPPMAAETGVKLAMTLPRNAADADAPGVAVLGWEQV